MFYQLLNIAIPATIARFHMTTQRSLSAAAPAHWRQIRLEPQFARRMWHRHSCLPRGTKGLCAVAGPGTQPIEAAASLPVHVLIANLELEFHLSHRKLSSLKIPNRKFLAISRIAFASFLISSSPLVTHHRSSVTHPNLSNPLYRD